MDALSANVRTAAPPPSAPVPAASGGIRRAWSALDAAGAAAGQAAEAAFANRPRWVRPVIAAILMIAALWALSQAPARPWGLVFLVLLTSALLVWWSSVAPSNDRDWQPDVAVLPFAERSGDRVTVWNIRNCLYRSEADYDVRHYDAAFDLSRLRTMDLLLVYWGSPHIAHTMVSFGFGGDRHLCISIETRKRKGQTYSAFRGFFKQYELTYIVGDERDLVGLRARHRGEQVYLYRLIAEPKLIREVFLDYLAAVNSLARKPEWYNAMFGNCTTRIRGHTRPYAHKAPWNWRLLLTGHLDEMLYDVGVVTHELPFKKLRSRSNITERVKTAGDGTEFSRQIRAALPGAGG